MVTLTGVELAAALGITQQRADALLAVAVAEVGRVAPQAPDAVANEAALRMCGHLAQQPSAAVHSESIGQVAITYNATGSPMRQSGAMALLARWRRHRGQVVT